MYALTPRRQLPCPTCGVGEHALTPTDTGAAWVCSKCSGHTHAFTHDDMRKLLMQFAQQLEAPSKKYQGSLEGIHVTVRLHPDWEPVEVDPRMLREHVEITGDLPVAGKPLYHAIPGIPISLVTVPFGVVEAVTKNEERPIH